MLNDFYTAGLLDGEGCFIIYVAERNSNYRGQIVIEIREEHIVDALCETYGGTKQFKKKRKDNHSDTFVWKATGKTIDKVLDRVQDKLLIKHRQAEVMRSFRSSRTETRNTQRLTVTEYSNRKALYLNMRELNSRGQQYRQLVG